MENSKSSVVRPQKANLYEFQARDKFFRLTRGRIEADSRVGAKIKLKSWDLYWPQIWLQGTKPWQSWFSFGSLNKTFVPTLKKKSQDNDAVVWSARYLPKLIFGVIFAIIGLGIILGYNPRIENIADWISGIFVFSVAILFLLIGISILLYRFELAINRQSHKLTLRISIIPGLWRYELIDGNLVKRIVCRQELVYPSGIAEKCYYVFAATKNKEIHLDSSSSKKVASEIGQTVAEYLEVPFVCEG